MSIQQLLTFEGGLSTKISPHLIGRNEGIKCENVNLETGTLLPLTQCYEETTKTGKYCHYFSGNIISNTDATDERFYVEYANRLYWSNAGYGTYGLMRYDGTDAGIVAEAPASPQNITDITIAEWNDTADDNGHLTMGGTYYYAFTSVDSNGTESAPTYHPTSITINVLAKRSIKISVDSDNVFDNIIPTGHTVNIYRTGGDNPTYNLIASGLSPAETICSAGESCYRDNTADIDITRIELTTIDNTPPPASLDMLIESLGTFWGASGKYVYFSKVGRPEFWGSLDFVALDSECTGLGKFGNNIYAFTVRGVYQIEGYSRDTVTVTKLPFNQGCVHKDTITNLDGYMLWVSKNGICMYDGSSINVITKQSIAWNTFATVGNLTYEDFNAEEKWTSGLGFEITYSIGYKDRYYGVYSNGLFIIDFANGSNVTTIDIPDSRSLFINYATNVVNVVIEDVSNFKVNTLEGTDNPMTATWKTGEISDEGSNVDKHYRDVTIDGTPNSIEIFVDGESKKVYTNKNRFKLPAGCIGSNIQFEIITDSEIRGLKYNYSQLKA
jgi:hypothetical protein